MFTPAFRANKKGSYGISRNCLILLIVSGVENIGVEPMTSCMPCKRSSQLS